MGQFIQENVLWDIAVWRLIVALVLIFLGMLSRRVIKAVFGGMVRRRAASMNIQWPGDLLELAPGPIALLVQVLLWFAVAHVMQLPAEPVDVARLVAGGLMVALGVAVTWLVFRLLDTASRAASRAAEKTETQLDDQIIPMARKTLKVFAAIVLAVLVIDRLGYSVASLITGLGIGGLAMALASKDTLANFFGSVIIFTDQPFHVGDWIIIGELEGIVEEVGLRTTRIRRFDRALATVPNQAFTNTTIVNHSSRTTRKIRCILGLTYETSPEQLEQLVERIREMLTQMPMLDPESHLVYFQEVADSSLNIVVQGFCLTTDYPAFMAVQQELLLGILKLVEAQGLEIAFPSRTVYLRGREQPQEH